MERKFIWMHYILLGNEYKITQWDPNKITCKIKIQEPHKHNIILDFQKKRITFTEATTRINAFTCEKMNISRVQRIP